MDSIVERYGDKFNDETYEYRQVTIRRDFAKLIPRDRLLSDQEWRHMGIQMSLGWEHYCLYRPQSYVLLFRRPVGTDGRTGLVDPIAAQKIKEQFRKEYDLPCL